MLQVEDVDVASADKVTSLSTFESVLSTFESLSAFDSYTLSHY